MPVLGFEDGQLIQRDSLCDYSTWNQMAGKKRRAINLNKNGSPPASSRTPDLEHSIEETRRRMPEASLKIAQRAHTTVQSPTTFMTAVPSSRKEKPRRNDALFPETVKG